MKKILLIEDDSRIRELIKIYLKKENYEVYDAESGEQGLGIFYEQNIDLVILDIMLPDIDGWSICKDIRRNSLVPIVMLTARTREEDELFGFELKVDDYIKKPFTPSILMARIKRILEKTQNKNAILNNEGEFFINEKSMKIFFESKELELSLKEYETLRYLINNKNMVLTRENILLKIWGYTYTGDERVIDTTIKRIRKKIPKNYIKTVRGIGYILEVENE